MKPRLLFGFSVLFLFGCEEKKPPVVNEPMEKPVLKPEVVNRPKSKPEATKQPSNDKVKIPSHTHLPFRDWWDPRCLETSYLTCNYLFTEKITNRRKAFKPKYAKLKFLRQTGKTHIMLSLFKEKKRGKDSLIDIKVITPKVYIEYYPAKDGGKAKRKVTKLDGGSNFLATALIYGRPFKELAKDFHIIEMNKPDAKGNWSFTLLPKDREMAKNLRAIKIKLNKADYKSVLFEETPKAWILFEFVGKQDLDSKITVKELMDQVK
jgi:hypothetical protein